MGVISIEYILIPPSLFLKHLRKIHYSVKTLHDQSKMFEGTAITKANPAQFSFTVPLTVEKDESIVMDLVADLVGTSAQELLINN